MIQVFVLNGVVIGKGVAHQTGVTIMPSDGATAYDVADDVAVDLGYTVMLHGDVPTFTAPAPLLPMLTPMTLYMAFTPFERIAIKTSTDPMVKEFWAMYELSVQLQKPTDPNLPSVQNALAYLAAPATPGPGAGAGILASPERINQILAGIPQ